MKAQKRIVILHGRVPAGARADEQDVLEEVRQVAAALTALGYEPYPLPLTLDLEEAACRLRRLSPLLVFNLVESIGGQDRLLHLATSLLDRLGIVYTGSATTGMFLASNKLLAKRLLVQADIGTPPWTPAPRALSIGPAFQPPYVVKSVWDNASLGLESVCEDGEQLRDRLSTLAASARLADVFVERYIHGREFNLSLLCSGGHPEVLPPAEMLFVDYPPEKPRIVGYAAKWDPGSFEYNHTVRRFDFGDEDRELIGQLCALARSCWEQLEMEGYARVDFRVDERGTPWVLEANPNPCISADAGLVAAASRSGLSYLDLIRRILAPVFQKISTGRTGEVPAAGGSGDAMPAGVMRSAS
jgi:D-alanine-D-alanine ligase